MTSILVAHAFVDPAMSRAKCGDAYARASTRGVT
jgi:hypothetical protein